MSKTQQFQFRCSKCSNLHVGAPSVAYNSPHYYHCLSESEKLGSKLAEDFCEVEEHRFIRVCLEIPIKGYLDTFLWGVWVSLSRSNYEEYKRNFKREYSAVYFGWFCSMLPEYPDTEGLKTEVNIVGNKRRPLISIQKSDHPLSIDFQNGMSMEKAMKIFEQFLHK